MNDKKNEFGFSTRAIHHGYNALENNGALIPPIYLTSTFAFASTEYGAACFAGQESGHFYTRISNPTLALLESRLATLENGEAGVAFSSGMGAIATTFWTLLRPGDELIVSRTLYGCTFALLHHGIGEFGINVKHVDMANLAELEAAITSSTRMIYFETPANPNMQLVDIAAVSSLAHSHPDITVVIDNTYCTPYLQRPLEMGADIVVHSARTTPWCKSPKACTPTCGACKTAAKPPRRQCPHQRSPPAAATRPPKGLPHEHHHCTHPHASRPAAPPRHRTAGPLPRHLPSRLAAPP